MEKITELKNALLKQGSIKGLVDSIVNDPNITTEDVAIVLNESTIVCENIAKVKKRLHEIHNRYNNLIDKYTKDSEEIKRKLEHMEEIKNQLNLEYSENVKKQKQYNQSFSDMSEKITQLQTEINDKLENNDDINKNTDNYLTQKYILQEQLEIVKSNTSDINNQITQNKTNLNTLTIDKQNISIKINQQLNIYQNLANNLATIQLLKNQISDSFSALDNAINELRIEKDDTASARKSLKDLYVTVQESSDKLDNLESHNNNLCNVISSVQNSVSNLESQIKNYENKLIELHDNHNNHSLLISDNLKLLETAKQEKEQIELDYNKAMTDDNKAKDILIVLQQQLVDSQNNYKQLEDNYNNNLSKSNDISKQISTCTIEINNILQNFNKQFTNMGLLVDKFNLEIIDMESQLAEFQIQDKKK